MGERIGKREQKRQEEQEERLYGRYVNRIVFLGAELRVVYVGFGAGGEGRRRGHFVIETSDKDSRGAQFWRAVKTVSCDSNCSSTTTRDLCYALDKTCQALEQVSTMKEQNRGAVEAPGARTDKENP